MLSFFVWMSASGHCKKVLLKLKFVLVKLEFFCAHKSLICLTSSKSAHSFGSIASSSACLNSLASFLHNFRVKTTLYPFIKQFCRRSIGKSRLPNVRQGLRCKRKETGLVRLQKQDESRCRCETSVIIAIQIFFSTLSRKTYKDAETPVPPIRYFQTVAPLAIHPRPFFARILRNLPCTEWEEGVTNFWWCWASLSGLSRLLTAYFRDL